MAPRRVWKEAGESGWGGGDSWIFRNSVSGSAPAPPPGYVVIAHSYGAQWLLGRGLSQCLPLA